MGESLGTACVQAHLNPVLGSVEMERHPPDNGRAKPLPDLTDT